MDLNCYNVIYRTTLFYIVLLIVFKLMGKREIGQLTLLDLVVSVLMAEIAAMAIDNLERPIHEVLLAIGLLGILQFTSAFITLRYKKIREFVDGKPSILIHQGRINIHEMRKQRYTFDDLMLQLRANNISSVFEFIATTDGSLSTIPLPFTVTRILAVPKSIPISFEPNLKNSIFFFFINILVSFSFFETLYFHIYFFL